MITNIYEVAVAIFLIFSIIIILFFNQNDFTNAVNNFCFVVVVFFKVSLHAHLKVHSISCVSGVLNNNCVFTENC